MNKLHNQTIAAAKSGMSSKTARKYLKKTDKLPSELKQERKWLTRSNIFSDIWPQIEGMLDKSPGLEAKTILSHLEQQDSKYNQSYLRTLQRMIKQYKAVGGKDKEVIFSQQLLPGRQSQSDYTSMNELSIAIAGKPFNHLLFHFMLPYSKWEHVSIAFSESFESLSHGYDEAVFALGGVTKEHRTDNLTAAVYFQNGQGYFTKAWQDVMDHYNVTPTSNNPGVSHENGSVEKSHDLLKNDIEQQLLLRGSNNFLSMEEYKMFLNQIIARRNNLRKEKLAEELEVLKALPERKYNAASIFDVKVSKFSTVIINKVTYSVASRLIGYRVRVHCYHDKIELYYGGKLISSMPKAIDGENVVINYRHIINSLVRKPGAFANYVYKDSLFPTTQFRKAYDALQECCPINCDKHYIQILQLAATQSETEVETALELLLSDNIAPTIERVKDLITCAASTPPRVNVNMPRLDNYDLLLTTWH